MSLSEYEEAMSTFHILHKFKHLFNSLEYSVNIDGKDLVNAEFDKHACHLFKPGILHSTEVNKWRELYNRIKHSERNRADLKKYYDGSKKLGTYILPIRKVCRELLLKQINLITP